MAAPNDLTNILDPNETVELYIKQISAENRMPESVAKSSTVCLRCVELSP